MLHKTFLIFVLLCVLLGTAVAQYGKVSGYVKDKESKEPLVGANVTILGTSFGAASDVEGRFVILNLPPGPYDIRASYVGYQEVVVNGIRVTSGLTETVNFEMQASSVLLPALQVTAERPLVEKSATNITRIVKAEDIENLPVRGIGAYMALQPGVAEVNGQFHIRGSREDEVGYYVEGANTKNLRGSGNLVTTIPEAVEEVLVQAGGYSAEFGGSNAGIIQQNLKTGQSRLNAFVQYETDDFGNYPYKQFLGTYSYGYKDLVMSVSGPATSNIRFFLAGENNFMRDYNPVFWYGADFGYLTDSGLRSGLAGDTSVAPLKWQDGNIPGRFANRYTANGTVLLDYKPLLVRLAGSYTWSRQKSNAFPIQYLFDQARLPYTDNTSAFVTAKATYFLAEKTFAEVNLDYVNNFSETYDPNFGSNWLLYADSAAAAQHGWEYLSAALPPYDYVFDGFPFSRPGAMLTGYSKANRTSYGFSANITSQMGRHELKVGGSYDYWTFRNYAIGGLTGLLQSIQSRPGIQNNMDEYLRFIRQSTTQLNNYGYNELGDQLNSGLDGPKHPYFASAYFQDKIEFDDLIINAGIRVDHMFFDSWKMVDPTNPLYDPINLQIGNLQPGRKFTYVQPRVGFSFPASDRTVFHMQYGRFIQAPDLNTMYLGRRAAFQYFLFAFQNPLGYDLSPIQTTQYEIGFTQQFTDFAAFDITGFYKDIKGLVQVDRQATAPGSPVLLYHIYVNSDFSTTTGLEFSLRLRRTNRMQAQINYTLSDAKGTNSFPNSAAATSNSGEITPTLVTPLVYSEQHRGAVSIDYRFGRGDGGPVLEEFGLNLLFTFNSGHPYTKATGGLGQQGPDLGGILNDGDARQRRPIEPIGSSTTPWVFNFDLAVDKSFHIGDMGINVYAKVLNVLNTKSVINVYYRTGNAYNDGFFADPDLSALIVASQPPEYTDMYNAINIQDRQHQWRTNGSDLFSSPRQIRLGVRFEY